MYIVTESRVRSMQIVNSEYVVRYAVVKHDDCFTVSAVLAMTAGEGSKIVPNIILGRYRDDKEARWAAGQLLMALLGDQAEFHMPESLLYSEQIDVHDARVKRRGGS